MESVVLKTRITKIVVFNQGVTTLLMHSKIHDASHCPFTLLQEMNRLGKLLGSTKVVSLQIIRQGGRMSVHLS